METTQEEAVSSRKRGRGKTWTQSHPQAQTWHDGSEVLGGTVFPKLSPEAPHTRRRGAAPHWWPQDEKSSIPFYNGSCILFLNIMETHAFNLSQENTNFTNHFWNVLSSRVQSITHKLSLLTKLYCSHLLTICSQSCYTLKVEVLAAQLCLTLCDPVDRSPPGGPGHGILQTRILEWTATAFSRGCSQPRGWTQVSRIADRFFTVWGTHYLLYDLNLSGRWEHRPEQEEDAPPRGLLTATPSDVRKPLERQVAKLGHTSPNNQARAVKLYVGIHKGEGAWNIIFLLMILIKGEQSTFWEQFPAGYLMRDWPEVRVSVAGKWSPNSEPRENSGPLPTLASQSKHSLLFSPQNKNIST